MLHYGAIDPSPGNGYVAFGLQAQCQELILLLLEYYVNTKAPNDVHCRFQCVDVKSNVLLL